MQAQQQMLAKMLSQALIYEPSIRRFLFPHPTYLFLTLHLYIIRMVMMKLIIGYRTTHQFLEISIWCKNHILQIHLHIILKMVTIFLNMPILAMVATLFLWWCMRLQYPIHPIEVIAGKWRHQEGQIVMKIYHLVMKVLDIITR